MNNKSSIVDTILNLFSDSKVNTVKTEEAIVGISKGYEDYLKKSPEYHDQVIKSMYVGTRFENESPDKLRQILRAQLAVNTEVLQ